MFLWKDISRLNKLFYVRTWLACSRISREASVSRPASKGVRDPVRDVGKRAVYSIMGYCK